MSIRSNSPDDFNTQGERLFADGDHEAAIACFEQALQICGDEPDVLNNLGVAHWQRGDIAASLGFFQRGLEVAPHHDQLVDNTSTVLDSIGRQEDARMLREARDTVKQRAAIQSSAIGSFRKRLAPLDAEPLVTIVMPTKDRPQLLADALASVVAQSYRHWELIVINDGGGSVADVARHADPRGRIRYLEHRRSLSQVAARNTALRLARGDVVCYLDDDDLFMPEHLATVVSGLGQDNAPFVYTDSIVAQEVCNAAGRRVLYRDRLYEHERYSRDRLLVSNYIPINTWAHRYECVAEYGFFDESLPALEDWELLLRWSQHFEFDHIRQTTVEVRERVDRQDNVSRRRRRSFVALYQQLYQRYPAGAAETVQSNRETTLVTLERQLAAEAGRVSDDDGESRYRLWREKHALTEAGAQLLAERSIGASQWARVCFLTIAANNQEEALARTRCSLDRQLHREWQWVVVSRRTCPPEFDDPRIVWQQIDDRLDPLALANTVAAQQSGEWLAWLDAGASLAPQALCVLASYINARPDWRLVYTDEDLVDAVGRHTRVRFKPDINPDLLRCMPYIGRFCLVRRDLWRQLGGVTRNDAAAVYDLCLRAYDAVGDEGMGHVAEVLYHADTEPVLAGAEDWGHGREVLLEHLARNDVAARVEPGLLAGSYWVDYQHDAQSAPLVSIVVPTRNALEFLRPCVDSVLAKTAYPNYELLIVDNGSDDADTLRYLEEVAGRDRRVRVLSYEQPFNYAAIHNWVSSRAQGDYLLLLNNDTQIIQGNWLDRMLNHGRRDEVGVVGARLVFVDQKLQHAGVVLGLHSVADHVHIGLDMREPGYLGRAQCVQNFSAVTAACLLIRKSVYEQVGGMDEERLAVLFNDVDLCLKVGQAGYRIVWTPYTTLIHHGSRSVKKLRTEADIARARAEAFAMHERWRRVLAHDPAYNRHLGVADTSAQPEVHTDVSWDPNFADRPRIMAFPFNEWGTGEYRVRAPLRALSRAAFVEHALMPLHDQRRLPTVCELDRAAPDVLLLQNMLHDAHLQFMEVCGDHCDAFRVFGQDDLLAALPAKNPYRNTVYPDVKKRLRRALALCDRLIVSTAPLAQAFENMIDDVVVVPNRLEWSVWGGLESRRRTGGRPRVGWAGAQQHQGDLELLAEVVRQTHHEVDWVFFGMCPESLRPYCAEYHQGVPMADYPQKLAGLDLDLAVAPLERNQFNEAKSNLRLLEYGVLGWPVVCSNITPYQDAPVCRVTNTTRAWVDAIRARVNDPKAAAREGESLRNWVRAHWLLEDHLESWYRALLPEHVLSEWLPVLNPDQTGLAKSGSLS